MGNKLPDDIEDIRIVAAAAYQLAVRFHEIYERLAPEFGYETREETREFDPLSKNGRLMIAVCQEILSGDKGQAALALWQEWYMNGFHSTDGEGHCIDCGEPINTSLLDIHGRSIDKEHGTGCIFGRAKALLEGVGGDDAPSD